MKLFGEMVHLTSICQLSKVTRSGA